MPTQCSPLSPLPCRHCVGITAALAARLLHSIRSVSAPALRALPFPARATIPPPHCLGAQVLF